MYILKKLLIGNEKNIMQKSAFWNVVESMEYSLQSAILLLVITRVGGLYDAGVFTIAYTFTQMIATIGSYGMRSFQVSDAKEEYRFQTYLCSRVISILAMVLVCAGYLAIQRYNVNKTILVLLLCLYRVVDDVDDLIHGEMQRNKRLDIAAKIASIRIFLATITFVLSYLFTKNVVVAALVMTLTAMCISFLLNLVASREFPTIQFRLSTNKVVSLLCACFPICVSGFLYNYLANSPKYAIDLNLSEDVQTIFSILFMPIFVINILSSFIFKPMIVSMGIMWNEKRYKDFILSVAKQFGIICVLTMFIMLCGAFCGVEVLGWLYGVDLLEYRMLFVALLAFGGFAAIVAFFVVVLTIIRKQKFILLAYGIAVVINLLFSTPIVLKFGIFGAGILYGITMGIIVLTLITIFILSFSKVQKLKHGHFEEDLS